MASEPYIGAIFIFAGNFNPRGYQLCQGQLLPIAQYTALFSILGTTYGGNGTSTFALPDLRGRAPVGQGTGPGLTPVELGEAAGVENVSILTSNMPAHNHLLSVNNQPGNSADPTSKIPAVINDGGVPVPVTSFGYSSSNPTGTMAPTAVGLTGSNVPINVQSPYLGINYIIAIEGLFPSRN